MYVQHTMQKVQTKVPNMALFCKPPVLIPCLNSSKVYAIQRPFSAKPAHSSKLKLNTQKVSIFTVPLCSNPSPQTPSCTATSTSFTDPNTSIIFLKGLPLSTSEGRLKMAFGSYGDVSRVKILTDKITREPLGFAYIWFSSPESAQTAVKEMNGEFFDGRFISVTIARPGSCMPRVRPKPLTF